MGTSGAFGGSETKKWKKVRLTLDEALDAGGLGAGGDDSASVDQIVSEIAEALISDDPSIRPNRRISNPTPSSTVESILGNLGRVDGTRGRHAAGGGGGRRSIGTGARSGGRGIFGGYAAARGDADALAEIGVSLGDLTGRPWVEQVLEITEAVIGSSSNADEHALRAALVAILMNMNGAAAADPGETIRDVVAAYVCELAVVELTAALTARAITDAVALKTERDIRNYIEVRRDSITVPTGAVHTVTDFEDAAELLTQEVLLILRAKGVNV